MKRLVKSSLGVVFVILSGTSVLATPQPSALGAPQTLEQSTTAPGWLASLIAGQGLDVVGGYAGRFTSAAPAPVLSNDGKSQPVPTDGLSMLAALAIMGGFVLRRFLR